MIVKVELGLYRPDGKRSVAIRNKENTIRHDGIATPEILKAMGNRDKKYFEALKGADKRFNLVKVVPNQLW